MGIRMKIQDAQAMAKAKGGKCLSKSYHPGKLLWECAHQHRWKTTANKIQQGQWCPYCSRGIGEECVRLCFQRVFQRKFPKVRPDWLSLGQGYFQELDGFNARMGVAFEHHGRHHYARGRNFFQKSHARNKRQRFLDRRKSRLCHQHGIRLVKIPEVGWRFPLEELLPEVIRRCRRLGIRVPAGAGRLRINYAPAWKMKGDRAEKDMELMRSSARKRGGKCLDSEWLGNRHKYRFRCANGHLWKAGFYDIVKKKTWCPSPSCMGRIMSQKSSKWWRSPGGKKMRERLYRQGQRNLVRLQKFAKSRGGVCLSREWLGHNKPHRFRCGDCGREWKTSAGNTLTHQHWCRICSARKNWEKETRKRDVFGKMKKIAKQRGGVCLSPRWLGASARYRFRCGKCGREWETPPSVILRRKGWCRSCSQRKRHARNRAKRRSPTPT
jgi:hypothetical protein